MADYADGKLIIDAYSVTAEDDVTSGDDVISGDDVLVGDDLNFAAGGTITNDSGQLVINPTTYTSIGTGSPSVATAAGDLYVQDGLEVDGKITADGDVEMLASDKSIGNVSSYGAIRWRATSQP